MNVKLPPQLEKYRQQIERSLKPSLKIVEIDKIPKRWESKFGGQPYWPKQLEYPVSKTTGSPLPLLAQLNFEKIPHLGPFPMQGMVQIYISDQFDTATRDSQGKIVRNEDGHRFGMYEKNKLDQRNFRVIYHPEIIKDENALMSDFSFLSQIGEGDYDKIEYTLNFEKHSELMSSVDPGGFDNGSEFVEDFKRCLVEHTAVRFEFDISVDGDKIGGYHFSSNHVDDRRAYFGEEKVVLLLQMDGCGIFKPMQWGDGGRAQFFITEKDLSDLDFSRVLYSWDST